MTGAGAPGPGATSPLTTIAPYPDDAPLTAAFDRERRPLLRITSVSSPAVVLGRGSSVEAEVDVAACLAAGVPLQRRRGGGCAVLLDPGNLVLAVVLPVPGLSGHRRWFARLSAWISDGLGELGVTGVGQRGICDLALGDRKLGGACVQRSRGRLYYTATLLVSPDIDLMQRCLRHPPREPEYRAGRSHRDFVTSLDAHLPGRTPGQWVHGLRSVLDLSRLVAPLAVRG